MNTEVVVESSICPLAEFFAEFVEGMKKRRAAVEEDRKAFVRRTSPEADGIEALSISIN